MGVCLRMEYALYFVLRLFGKEREACVKVCDSLYDKSKLACGGPPTAEGAAKAIRGR